MAAAVLVLHQGFDWRRTMQRGIERTLGTWLGLVLAGGILLATPGGPWLAVILGALQFLIEMFVVRNYTMAVIFITPAALTIASGGHHVADVSAFLLARGVDTAIGCAVALLVFWLTRRDHPAARPPESIAATLDAISVVVRHLAAGAVTTDQARGDRRDLQLRAMAMLPVYDTAIGGSTRSRVAAERLWPTIVATEQLAYRTLAASWATERSDSPITPDNAERITATIGDLAHAVRTGRPATDITEPPVFGATELGAIRASLA